ncbi:hypothetical protein [Ideonella sp. BN130291]|uniref:hypothetical protein n=1 Tax=Ideonella sp. BN130291 TaxID=3112940 RepID=UPI002E2537AC|nr:hypothetical protein [Ideonella sp. BN130291]
MNPKPDESNPDMQGEGNYVAGRHYNEATKQFVEQGKVDGAAAAAKPESPDEARDLERAEEEGKSRAKGEDPQLKPKSSGEDQQRPK